MYLVHDYVHDTPTAVKGGPSMCASGASRHWRYIFSLELDNIISLHGNFLIPTNWVPQTLPKPGSLSGGVLIEQA